MGNCAKHSINTILRVMILHKLSFVVVSDFLSLLCTFILCVRFYGCCDFIFVSVDEMCGEYSLTEHSRLDNVMKMNIFLCLILCFCFCLLFLQIFNQFHSIV